MSEPRSLSRRLPRRVLPALAAVAVTFAVAACNGRSPAPPAMPNAPTASGEKTFSSQITGYNHTDKTIGSFSVNGVWGGNATPGTGGGKFTCCVQLPLLWHPGLSVKVEWEDDQGAQHQRNIPVPAYKEDSTGIFNVHFLRGGEIKVFDLNAILGHPDYPLQGEEAELRAGVPNFQFPRERPASS